jgi:hypothetical protein
MRRYSQSCFVFELFCLVLLPSNPDMSVDRWILTVARRLRICRILRFHLLPILLADVLSTCQGFVILKVDCHCWSASKKLMWIKLGNLLAWWSRCLRLRARCLTWWPRSFTLRSAILSLLGLLNQLASNCNVSSLKLPCAFCCVAVIFYVITFLLSRCLLKPHRRESSGFRMDCGSWEGIIGYQHLLDWSAAS